ncbi:MAG: hypothetical protein B6244_10475 [Candidatus Cloacimonetes bacterium 4572_55]|nr:MAG: hypothetical protein B6244_10475 [Candidatus Cloacimonetes bacterium 4572_55]
MKVRRGDHRKNSDLDILVVEESDLPRSRIGEMYQILYKRKFETSGISILKFIFLCHIFFY